MAEAKLDGRPADRTRGSSITTLTIGEEAVVVAFRRDTLLPLDDWTPGDIEEMRAQKLPFRCHSFELACADLDIEHRLTKPRHPGRPGRSKE